MVGCNGWNHPPGCTCGWGGVNYGCATTPLKTLSHSAAWAIWRSFVNPNARCPKCKRPVFYYQSEHGGRVFFDQLGPPWPKHPCTVQPTWRWPTSTELRPKKNNIKEPSSPPDWQHEGWVPVAKVETTGGRITPKKKDSLMGAIVWSAVDASKLEVLWPIRRSFHWSGVVMMRPDPRSPHRVEFKSLRWDGRVERLIAVKNNIRTSVTELLSTLREQR